MISKKLFQLLSFAAFIVISQCCFSQGNSKQRDLLSQVSSTDSFSFCSINFSIPQNCGQQAKYGHHSYVNEILKDQTMSRMEVLSCDDETLSWNYLKDAGALQTSLESMMLQLERQMKKFEKKQFGCLLLNREATGYKINMQPEAGPEIHEIIAYGYVNGQNVLLELVSAKEIKNSKTLGDPFNQIIEF
jgi:hypothetical protein